MDRLLYKIIIFSFSEVAQEIAKTLSSKGYQIIIVEEDLDLVMLAKNRGYDVFSLSLMSDENIVKVGVYDKALKAFFVLSDDKNTNLFVTLSVRNLNKEIKIISASFTKEDNDTMLFAGASKVINPHEIGALRIFRYLHEPLILDAMDNILFSDSDIEVAEITIQKGDKLDGVYLKDITLIQKYNLILLGVQDEELGDSFIFNSKGINHKIDYDDTLVLLGHSNSIKQFKKELNHN